MNRIFPAPRLLPILVCFLGSSALQAQLADIVAQRRLALDGTVEADLLLLDSDGELAISDNARVKGDVRLPRSGNAVGEGRAIAASVKKNISGGAGSFDGNLRDSDTPALPQLAGPKPPRGSRNVHAKGNDQPRFDGARDIIIENTASPLSLPAGQYGALTVDNAQLILGAAGDEVPARYDFSSLELLHRSLVTLAGPVILTVDHVVALNGVLGREDLPGWLDFRVAQGTIELSAQAAVYGTLFAPFSAISLKNGAALEGWLAADAVTVAQNGRFKSRRIDWDPVAPPSRHPTFPQRSVLVQGRIARLKDLFAGHYEVGAGYDADIPTITLTEVRDREGDKSAGKDISIFFDTFSALLSGTFVEEARLVIRKAPGRSMSGHQVVDVSMTRRSFEDHLRSLSHAPTAGECVRDIQRSVGLQNVFMLWSLSGTPTDAR